MRKVFALLAPLLLTGCLHEAVPELAPVPGMPGGGGLINRLMHNSVPKEEREAKLMAELKAKCEKFGFTPETEAFSTCLLSLHNRHEADLRARESRPVPSVRLENYTPAVQPPIRCSSSRMGRDVVTTCN